jgi:hypothetical protein
MKYASLSLSVQFIDPEASSFAQVGNSQGVTGPTTVLLRLGHAPNQAQEGNEHVIASADERGVVLLRYLAGSTSDAPKLDALRRQVSLRHP